jgi:hypothetical protein
MNTIIYVIGLIVVIGANPCVLRLALSRDGRFEAERQTHTALNRRQHNASKASRILTRWQQFRESQNVEDRGGGFPG